jgi:hypothetical protein
VPKSRHAKKFHYKGKKKMAIKRMARYQIFSAPTPEDLATVVSQALANGMGLCGGPFISPGGSGGIAGPQGLVYNQAMYILVEQEVTDEEARAAQEAAERKSAALVVPS